MGRSSARCHARSTLIVVNVDGSSTHGAPAHVAGWGMADRPSLSTSEAAARLGVKPETVYAYVSRGLITRHLADDGRTSRLDAADVERLARRGRRPASRRSALDVVLTTAITRIEDDTLRFRG